MDFSESVVKEFTAMLLLGGSLCFDRPQSRGFMLI